ncbi:hypothetical protein H4R33_004493 [Dimargaris cristalligena]|nr:hypothetical protein H4R33_004493 [Dimargaris cristalligena]
MYSPVDPNDNTRVCMPAVPIDYQPAADLPLGKPHQYGTGYASWLHPLPLPASVGGGQLDPTPPCQMALALLLSRYHRQPGVAFAHWTGPIGEGEAAGHQLNLVLSQVKPDLPLDVSIMQEVKPVNSPGSTSHVAEVILHVDNPWPSKNHRTFLPADYVGQLSESDADPSTAAILIATAARLMVSCEQHHDQVRITVTYPRTQYHGPAVAEFALQLGTILSGVMEALGRDQPVLVRDIPWVSDNERTRLMEFSRMNETVQPVGLPVHCLFSQCAQRYPHHLALAYGPDEWTYSQLDQVTSNLARVLVEEYGARPEVRFAIFIPKSAAFNITMLAIFKSGAAYVPIDPDYPIERIRYILKDSDALLAIATSSTYDYLPAESTATTLVMDSYIHHSQNLDVPPFTPNPSNSNDLAYMIYTSGSTGQPKGVLVEHGGVASLVADPYLAEDFGPGKRTIQGMSVVFDAFLVDTLRTLCHGGTLIVPGDNILDDMRTLTSGSFVPSFVARLDPDDYPNLELIGMAGEPITPEIQTNWAHRCRMVNYYGPSEATIYSHSVEIGSDHDITIGKPIRNTFCFIVDDQLQLVPVGVPGELLIGGIGLARGYQNLPELTQAKFISNPYGPGRVYRTGDQARWLANGTIDFLGRIDNQIKLRGYRIELEEIESVSGHFPGLKQCVASVKHDTLVLYASPTDLDQLALLSYLKKRLSKQMVPGLVVLVTEFKTTVSGKLDRKSLPPIDHLLGGPSSTDSTMSKVTAPQSDSERDLCQIWAQVLHLDPDRISTTDHFFRIGGDSISAILLVSKGRQIGYQLAVPLIYQYPELRQLAQHTEKFSSHLANVNAAYQEQVQGAVTLTPIQRWFSAIGLRNPHHFNQSFTLNINPKASLSLTTISDALVALANHHDILRARFKPSDDGWLWVQAIPTARAMPADFLVLEETVSSENYVGFILRVQSSLNLTAGPVLAVALIHDPDSKSQPRLFITIHHVLVDLIAWRILIEDLNTLLRGASLPPKSLPFQVWASQLDDYAATLSADIWPTQLNSDKPVPDIRVRLPPPELDATRTQAARLSTSFEFDSESTYPLLFQLSAQLRVTPRDLLLAAFTHAFATTIGLDQVTFCMEGHGREPWLSDQDISRTVGWFTALYPLVLQVQPHQPLLDLLRHTKEALQQIPMKGFPYSLLKYMPGVSVEERAKLEAKTPASLDVQFNYFGRFSNTGGDLSDDLLSIEWSDYFGLHDFAPQDKVIYDINPMPTVVGDCLRLIMEFNPLVYCRSIVDEIMAQWRQNLVQLASEMNQSQSISVEPLLTRYDFAHLQPSTSEFQEIIDDLCHRHIPLDQVEDVLPCIALQGGLLTGLSTDASAYLVQLTVKFNGPLNADRLLQAWQAVAQQNTALRTVFLESSSKQSRGYIQAVLRSCPTAWTVSDQPLKSLDEFLAQNRQRGFTLQEHMIRNFVFPTVDNQVHDVIITFHHSLCDGWSLPLLFQAWMEAYHHPNLEASSPSVPFSSIIQCVSELNSDSAQAFWGSYLKDAPKTPAPLLSPGYIGLPGWATYLTGINLSKTQLTQCSQMFGVTLATLFRAAYALVLGSLLDQDEVVFGVTLSGRNLGLPGIERTIGPCTNTLPSRVRLDHQLIADWLQTLHQGQVAMIPFEHSVLTDITKWASTDHSGPLFQTIMGFENFPELVADPTHSLVLSDLRTDEFTEYPLAIDFIESSNGIKAKVFYDTSIYSEESVSQIVDMVQFVLTWILVADINTPMDQLALASPPSNSRLHVDQESRRSTTTPAPPLLNDIWNNSLLDSSDHLALDSKAHSLSYSQLDQLAHSLAVQSSQFGLAPHPTVVAVVDSVEHLLVCLATISAPDSPIHKSSESSPCHVIAGDSLSHGSVLGDRLILFDLKGDTWPHVESLDKSTDTCLAFIESIFHGHRRITPKQLASRSLPAMDKPLNGGYALDVLGKHGHPSPPGVVGRLAFLGTSFPYYPASSKQSVLGYRDAADIVHILGPASQRVAIKHRQVHLAALVPDEIISTNAFPHVTDLNDQLLPHFAIAYLVTLPTRSAQSLSDSEWWLTVVVNELYASANHTLACSNDTAPLISTSRIPLAQLDLLQYRIYQKFGIAVGLGELVKHTEIRTLASIIQDIIKQAEVEESPDFTVNDTYIPPLKASLLHTQKSTTSHQQRVWSLSRLGNPSSAFHHHCTIISKILLQLEEVQQTIDHLTIIFESLRCRFLSVRGVLTCHVLPRVSIRVTEHQLPSSQVFNGDQFDVHAPQFDLNQGVLVQLDLYQWPTDTVYNNSSVIVIRVHEILGSTSEFEKFVHALTNQLVGHSRSLPDVQFTRVCSTGEPTKVDFDYWATLLQNPPVELSLPTDRPRPLLPSFLCDLAETEVEGRLFEAIQVQASNESVKEYGIWSSLFSTFMLRLTGQTDLIMDINGPDVGNSDTSAAMATLSELRGPLRVNGILPLDFSELAERLIRQLRDSRPHVLPSTDDIVTHLSPEGQHRISGLSHVSVVFHHHIVPRDNSTLHCTRSLSPWTMFPYDLQLVVDFHDLVPMCQLRFNQSLFNVDTANRLLHNFLAYAHSVVVAHQPWSTTSLVCPTEATLILDKFALGSPNPITEENPCLSLLDLFFGMAQKYPNRVATEIGNDTHTYTQLTWRVLGMVERLRRANVQPRDKVGVIVSNHPDTVMCMLAVWGVGAVYVPVDSKHPIARQKYIVETAGCTCMANASGTNTEWREAITIDDLIDSIKSTTTAASLHPIQPTELAYVVFTSGSTGLPKGVMVEHRSLLNIISNPTLEMLRQPDPQDYTNLTSLVVGGEHIPRELASQWSAVTTFYNIYGPTEATIACLFTEVRPSGCIPIGQPMADYECYILDSNLQVVPIGAVGEICIGGVGVTLGYINRPDLNLNKFVANLFTGHGKIYRTGDLGRWLPDGQVVCLGRMDSQVKLRGFRIELDEIRSVLMRQPGVQDCAVFIQDQFLVGYVFPDSTSSENVLRASAADQLPSYMVPSYILSLPSVPLTNNGKCDTQFLQNHFAGHLATQRQQVPLADSSSEWDQPLSILMQSLGEVLGLPMNQINPDLTFVKIGGDSISAIQVSSKCRQLGFTLPISALLGSGPLRDATKKLSPTSPAIDVTGQSQSVEYHTKFPLTPIQQWFFDHPWSNPNHFNQSFALELTRPLTVTGLDSALLRLINCHDMLRCRFTHQVGDNSGQWSQQIEPPFVKLPIPIVESNISSSDLPRQLNSVQSSLDITQGHHLAAGLITLSDSENYTPASKGSRLTSISPPFKGQLLFLTIHHLVVDLVSWSVVLEDLAQILDGQPPVLQPLQFSTWATELVDWVKIETSNANPSHPHETPQASFLPLAELDCLALNTQANTQCQSVTFDPVLSEALLQPDTTHIQPLELMLAGLFQALHFISQAPSITVFNESHGRHPWQSNLDPSRTVGWFTSIYPCRAEVGDGTTLIDYLKQAKQALHLSSGPRGLQYGLQQLLHRPQSTSSDEYPYSPMDVCFNYLGHTTSSGTLSMHGRAPWTLRPELTTNLAICDPSELRAQVLEVVGLPTSGGLTFMVYYCPQVIPTSVIASLLDHVRQSLKDIVQYLDLSHHPSLWIPLDFPSLNTTLPELAKLEAELTTVGLSAHEVEDLYPMLPMQQGMWTATAKDPTEYLVQMAFTVTGVSNSKQLQDATQAIVNHHTILRTVFVTSWCNYCCQGVQVVTREPRFGWNIVNEWSDFGAFSEENFLQVNLARGFQPNEPLLRIFVKQMAPDSFRYLLTIHHSLIDGWSIGIMLDQLRSHLQGNVELTSNSATSFHEYVSYLHNSDKKEAEAFWKDFLRGVEQPTELCLPKPPSAPHSRKADLLFTLFPDAGQLHQVARHAGVTPYTIIRAAWSLLLSRYTDQTDVVFGNTVSGRALPLPGIESLLGCFINTVPFRVSLKSEMSVIELVTMIHQRSQMMIPFEHLHLSNINEWVDDEVHPSDMFNTLLVYENYPGTGLESLGHSVTFTDKTFLESTDYPLAVIAQVENNQLSVNLNWSTPAFDRWYMVTLSHHLTTLFSDMVSALANSNGYISIKDLSLLSTNETTLVTEQLARPHLAIDFEMCVPDLFTQTAHSVPDTNAVEFNDSQWTYQDLHIRSVNLSHRLLLHGIRRETPIGLIIDRVPSTIAAYMGVGLAGAAIVPIDPAFPSDRIHYMVNDCGIQLLLTNTADQVRLDAIRQALPHVELQTIDPWLLPPGIPCNELPALPNVRPTDLSHILYTSGTTGRPKGVQLEHRVMANFVQQVESTIGITSGLRLMQNMALTFDCALLEIFTGLCKGATLVLRTDLLDTLPRVDALVATPSVLASLDPRKYPGLKMIIAAGEALPRQVTERWSHHCRVFNMYGPTECFVCHAVEIRPGEPVTIGHPVPNTECYILDRYLQPVPPGVPGEIYVGGICVTRGYVNLPELTRERLLPNSFTGQGYIYRTGDTGRWLPNGTVEYFARRDDQVKIRGHRVEPQEIEAILLSYPAVQSAAVVINSGKLYGFVSPKSVPVGSLKSHSSSRLPPYMIPQALFAFDLLPSTTNGKTDKRALVDLLTQLNALSSGRSITRPRNPTEAQIVKALSQTLDIPTEDIDMYDSFFQLGGDSISAIRFSSLCRDFGLHVPISQIFKCSNFAELAEFVAEQSSITLSQGSHPLTDYQPFTLVDDGDLSPTTLESLIQEAASQLNIDPLNITDILPVSSLQQGFLVSTLKDPSAYMVQESFGISGPLDFDRLQRAWHRVAQQHGILRTKFIQPRTISKHTFLQVVTGHCDVEWSVHTETSHNDWPRIEKEYFAADRQRGFAFNGPLLRIGLYTPLATEVTQTLGFLTFHHALLDAWSQNIIMSELIDLYQGAVLGPATQFTGYMQHLQSLDQSQLQKFWRFNLDGAKPTPAIQFPIHTNERILCEYGNHRFTFSTPLPTLNTFCRQQRITLNSLLRGVWALTLARYLGESDEVTFGVLTSGRNVPVPGIDGMVGMCINTLPFRASLGLDTPVVDFIQRLHLQSGELTASEQCSLLDILKWGQVNPEDKLFDSLVVYDNIPATTTVTTNPEIAFELRDGQNFTEYVYTVSCTDSGDNLDCYLLFKSTHCDSTYAHYLTRFLDHCLSMIVTQPTCALRELMVIPADEAQLIHGWSQGPVRNYSQRHELAYQLFTQNLLTRPGAIALEATDQQFTYAEVYHRSCCIALTLQQSGFKPGTHSALLFPKSADFIFSYIGTLMAGGICIPMDVSNAVDRLLYTFSVLDEPWLLTTTRHFNLFEDHVRGSANRFCLVDTIDPRRIITNTFQPDSSRTTLDSAYIVFTSGTTGRPKGIPVRHESLVNFILTSCETTQLDSNSRILQTMNISFDGCLIGVFGAFHCGGTLVLQDGDILDTLARVNTCILISSMLSIVDAKSYPNLKTVFTGGEAVPIQVAHKWCKHVRLFNFYGPIEITITSHIDEIQSTRSVSIGRPLANIQGLILDDQLRPVPIGVSGELCIGGIGVSTGYWKQPELTAKSFIPNPYGPGCLYRTGDLVCWLSSGKVQFISRKDFQVKLRGYRIELGEIESTASLMEGVTNAIACINQQQLVLYIAPSSVDTVALKIQIASKLPQYMVPSFIIPLDCIPITTVGKADRKALQARPLPLEITDEAVDIETLSPVFLLMREALADTLKIGAQRITPSASFLRLGGDSISAIQYANRCKRLGLQLSVADILKHTQLSTMEQYAHLVDSENTALIQYLDPVGPIPLTAVQRYALKEYQLINQFNQSMLLKCRQTLTRTALTRTLISLMTHHDILRIRLESSNSQWQQRVLPLPTDTASWPSQFLSFEEVTLTLNEYPAWASQKQRNISIEQGPVVVCGLLTLDGEQHVYLTIHHFAVDFISWRIILEDLEVLLTNQNLPAKTMSFREWATKVTFGISVIELELEGHGRRPWDSTIDISRTVGWFTSIYPVMFDLNQAPTYLAAGHNLRALALAKQRMRSIPDHGFPHSLQRYLKGTLPLASPSIDRISPQALGKSSADWNRVTFNYSGRFEQLEAQDAFWCPRHIEMGWADYWNKDEVFSRALSVACDYSVDEGLVLSVMYSNELHRASTIQRLVDQWRISLEELIFECKAAPAPSIVTASDFSSARLTEADFAKMVQDDLPTLNLALADIEDIYPCLPVQEGLLFATLQDPAAYMVQLGYTVKGQLNIGRFHWAWDQTAQEHSILRTRFLTASGCNADKNLQVVAKDFNAHWLIRMALGSNPSVRDTLQAVYSTSTRAHGFEHCRLTDIHRWSGLSHERLLFNTLLVLENYPENSENPDLPFQLEPDSFWDPTDFPLAVIAHTQGDKLQFRVAYRSLDFTSEFVNSFADHFVAALSTLLTVDAGNPITDTQILPTSERAQLLENWATNPRHTPRALAHDLFEQQCERTPHLTALIHNGQQYTYAQLDMTANRLAHSLALKAPCGSDRIVALIADNCPELIIGQLAIWKTGCAFVILAPDYPAERHQLILEDTHAIAVMGKAPNLSTLNALGLGVSTLPFNITALLADSPTGAYPSPAIDPSHLAAIIYTSGSTGIPKGVMHEHHALANHWQGMASITNITPGTITPTLVTPTFDVSLSEIWTTLSFGGTLLVTQGEYEGALAQATRACCTPSLLSGFDPINFPNLRQVIITGEPANQGIVNKWADSVDLINWYGPTEVACGSHWTRLYSTDSVIPIGTPLPNATGIILDTHMNLVPVGAIGQLYLGGRGLARGYLNRPELTQDKFIHNPSTDERIYQSGDLARWLPNGQIECLGRIDNQVKLRGFRIELGEIESALERHPTVNQACVVIQDENHLIGYVVPPSSQMAAIMDSLRTQLPYYMVPSVLVELVELPLTRVGKVDRKALPRHIFTASSNNHEAVQVSPAEARLIGLVAETLRIDPSGIPPAATFFQVGGNSLSAIQLVSRCRRQNLHLALVDISRSNTIAYLAELISTLPDSIEVLLGNDLGTADSGTGVVRLTPPQLELFALQLADPHYFPLPTVFESRTRFTAQQWQAAWAKVVRRHDMLRACFQSLNGGTAVKITDLADPSPTCFQYHQLNNIYDALAQLNEVNHQINFETGPISQVRVFDINDVQYVYIAVHHLVFDYLSVQIVREDLSAFLSDQTLEPTTLSYKAWADHLWSLAQTTDPSNIALPTSAAPLPLELPVDDMRITNETRERAVGLVDQSVTRQLINTVAKQLGATPVELILTALVCAYNRHFGFSQMDMAYLSHGRKDPRGQCDVSRTVGFFACQFPLVFQCASNGDLVDTLRAVQATLSTGVDNGFLYTVVKNLHSFSNDQIELKQQFDAQPQFGFTYLDDMAVRTSSDLYTLLVERPAMLNDLHTAKSQNKYPFVLDFAAWNTTGGLELITNFNSKQFRMDTISKFIARWKECLLELSRI